MLHFLKSVAQSFYSATFYRELAIERKGIGLGFILLASFLSVAPIMQLQTIDDFFRDKAAMFDALPPVSVKGGVLSMEAPSPQVFELLKKTESNPIRVVIDLNVDANNKEALQKRMEDENIVVLVSKNSFVVYDKAQKQIDVSPLSRFKDSDISHQDWIKIGESIDLLFGFGLLCMVLGFAFFAHLITAAAGGGLLTLIGPLFAVRLPFKPMMRVAAAAKLPVACLALVVTPHLALQGLVWFGFAAFGLLACRIPKQVGKAQ